MRRILLISLFSLAQVVIWSQVVLAWGGVSGH